MKTEKSYKMLDCTCDNRGKIASVYADCRCLAFKSEDISERPVRIKIKAIAVDTK